MQARHRLPQWPMANCKLCHAARLETESELIQTICAPCATKIGTTPMPPPRRPDVPCSRCRGTRFIRVFPRERFVIDTASKWLGADLGSDRGGGPPVGGGLHGVE